MGRQSSDLHAVLEGRTRQTADANFFKISLLGPTTATANRKVLARFTNGAAALVEASIGAGRTLLFTSTLDRDWNDLPIHPGFLPLVQQTVRYLARKHAASTEREHFVGSSVSLPTGNLEKLEVRRPDNVGEVFEGDSRAGRPQLGSIRAHRPPRHLPRDRHRQDRHDAAARRRTAFAK